MGESESRPEFCFSDETWAIRLELEYVTYISRFDSNGPEMNLCYPYNPGIIASCDGRSSSVWRDA